MELKFDSLEEVIDFAKHFTGEATPFEVAEAVEAETPAPAEEVKAETPEPAPVEEKPKSKKKRPSKSDLIAKAGKVIEKLAGEGRRDDIVAALEPFGVTRASQLKVDDLIEFIEKLDG